ncbi:MAG TPA: PilN domain-containing protein, partial [Gemmatimonadales bacterium]|nr:PilN domain-containing protein [Gemmatimonadales bacterium]
IYLSPWDDGRGRALQSLLPKVAVRPFPAVGAVTDSFLPAFGAALAIGARREYAETLVPPALATRITTRRWRVRGAGLAALILTFGFAVTSLDAWRARATRELETGLQALRRRAAPALVAQTRLEALGREAQAIHATERQRPDPLGVLLALSTHLPAGAYLRGLRWSGGEWQIDGYAPNAARLVAEAPNAARLVAELGATATFTDVRFLSATTRVALGKRTYENFALAFRYARAP